MNVFQLDGMNNHLYFQNIDRIEERQLCEEIVRKLSHLENIEIGDKQTGPTEDFYICKVNNQEFTLFLDITDGPFIYAEDNETIQIIKQII